MLGSSEELSALGEFIVYHLLKKMECDPEYPLLYAIPNDNNELDQDNLGKLLKDTEGLDLKKTYQNVKNDIGIPTEPLSLQKLS